MDEVGPTIDWIGVKNKYRGNGFCLRLYTALEDFILDRWTAGGKLESQTDLSRRIMATMQSG
jgi:hypothetical protein